MRFIILYGPPAVGKLTIAKELAKITGFRLFHNHLSVDLVASLFPFDTTPFWKYIRKIRLMLIEAAAKNGIDTIFTFVYAAGEDDKLIEKYIKTVEKEGGEVNLVQLITSKEKLKSRVTSDDRKIYRKMSSPDSLELWFEKYKLFNAVPNRQSLTIDNTNLIPAEVAKMIVDKFKVPTI